MISKWPCMRLQNYTGVKYPSKVEVGPMDFNVTGYEKNHTVSLSYNIFMLHNNSFFYKL